MKKETNNNYIYYDGKIKMISKDGIEWLCKRYFKQKYLDLLITQPFFPELNI